MADNGTTSPAGIYTTELTTTPVSSVDQSNSSKLLSTYFTEMIYYDSNDRGVTIPSLNTNSSINGTVASITYFKMRGYYTIGGVYETYIVTGSPSLTVPSGHVLTNIAVVTSWTV
jgi:hypothetical protein